MTDIQDFQFERPKESYEAYLRRRAIEHGDLSAQRQLERAELRASERGFLEALTTTANGRDRSFSDLLGFVGTANEAIYLNEIREAREAMDAGNATVAQRKMYERWEDFSVRSSSWWAHVGDIAAQAPAFMQEMAAGGVAGGLARGAVSQLGKTGLRKTLLGRTAAAISRPVRKFDAGLANVIQRSAQAAQGTAAATPYGQVGLKGVASALTRAATTGAPEQVVAQTVLGEAFGAVYGGGSRFRVGQLNRWLQRNGARDPMTGALRALDNEFGLWTDAAPEVLDLYIEMFSEMSGLALVQFPAAAKIALTGKGFAKSGTSNRMMSLLGLSADPADLGRWNRTAFSGVIPEIGEEFVGAAARDMVAAVAPELNEGGNTEYLVENIGAVSMGLALGMGGPAALTQTRNAVDPVLAWAKAPAGLRGAYANLQSQLEKAEREGVVSRMTNVLDFARKGFTGLGSAQIAMSENLRGGWFGSQRVQEQARTRVIQDRSEGDLRPPQEHEVEEEIAAMWGETLKLPLLNEDKTESPLLERLRQMEVLSEKDMPFFLEEVARRAEALQVALEDGSLEQLSRIHAEDVLARDIAERDRAAEPEVLRVARDREAARRIQEETMRLAQIAGFSPVAAEGEAEVAAEQQPVIEGEPPVEVEAMEEVAPEVMAEQLRAAAVESLVGGVARKQERERVKKGLGQIELTEADRYEIATAVDVRVAEISREAKLEDGELRVVDYQSVDMPGARFANTLGVPVVEVSGPRSDVPAAFFDRQSGLMFVDRARLEAEAKAKGDSSEDLVREAMLHEVGHAALQSIAEKDRAAVVEAWNKFLETAGFGREMVADKLERYDPKQYSEQEIAEESVVFRFEHFAKLIDNGELDSSMATEAAKQGPIRKFVEGMLQVALPRTAGIRRTAKEMRQKLGQLGYDTEGMSDERVLAYTITGDAIVDLVLRPEIPIRDLMRPAIDDLEEAVAATPAGFWQRLRGERPLPTVRGERGLAGLTQFHMPSAEGVYGSFAAGLRESTGVPTVVSDAGEVEQQRNQAVAAADGVVLYLDAAVSADKREAQRLRDRAKKAGKSVIQNPTGKQLRKWLEKHSLAEPAIVVLGPEGSAPALKAYRNVQIALGSREYSDEEVSVTPTFSRLEELGPYGGLTAKETIRRWRKGEDIAELRTQIRKEGLPKTVGEADSVIFVGTNPTAWETVQKELEGLPDMPQATNPLTWQELASFLALGNLNRPLLVGTPEAVKRAEAMWEEAINPYKTVESVVVMPGWEGGRFPRLKPINRTATAGHEALEAVAIDVHPWRIVTNWGRPTYTPRGEELYEPSYLVVVPDAIIGTPAEDQMRRAQDADMVELSQMANELGLSQNDYWWMRYLDKPLIEAAEIVEGTGRRREVVKRTSRGVGERIRRHGFRTDPVYTEPARQSRLLEPGREINKDLMALHSERDALIVFHLREAVKKKIVENTQRDIPELEVDRRVADYDETFKLPRGIFVPFATAKKGDTVYVDDDMLTTIAKVVDVEGDYATISYQESNGRRRQRRTKRSNLYHHQLSLRLQGTMPVFSTDGDILVPGSLSWRRGISYGQTGERMMEPRLGQATRTIEPREGESNADYQARVLEEGIKILKEYPRLKDIAAEGRYVPTLEAADEVSQREQREVNARLTAASARAGIPQALAAFVGGRADVIAPPNAIRMVNGRVRLNYARREELRALMSQLQQAGAYDANADIQVGAEAELTQFERETLEALDSSLMELVDPINDWISKWYRNKVGIFDLTMEIKRLEKERGDASEMTPEEAMLRVFVASVADTIPTLTADVEGRLLTLAGGEAMEGMAAEEGAARSWWDDMESANPDWAFFNGVLFAALGSRDRAYHRFVNLPRVGEEKTLKEIKETASGISAQAARAAQEAELVEEGEFTFFPDEEMASEQEAAAARAFRQLIDATEMDMGARRTMLPEVAARMLGLSWSLYKGDVDAMMPEGGDVAAKEDALREWSESSDRGLFMRAFDAKPLQAIGQQLAPVIARAAVLSPRAKSYADPRKGRRHHSHEVELRHSALTLVAQLLQSAGYGPASKGYRGFVPLVAMSDATPKQLLKLLGLEESGLAYNRLTPAEMREVVSAELALAPHRREKQYESELEMVKILSDGDMPRIAEWFERFDEADFEKRYADIIKERDRLEALARERLDQGVRPYLTEEEVSLANQLAKEEIELQELRKLQQRLQENGDLAEFKQAVKAYAAIIAKGAENARERDTAARAADAFYAKLRTLNYFRKGRGRKALRTARAISAVRSARLMLQYDLLNAKSVALQEERAQQAGQPGLAGKEGLGALRMALQQSIEQMQGQYDVLSRVEEMLLQTQVKAAAQMLVQDHMSAPLLRHAAVDERVSEIGGAKGLRYMEDMLLAAADGGQELVIVPRGKINLYIPLDPTVVYSPEVAAARELASDVDAASVPSSLNRSFGIHSEYAFGGNASAAGIFRAILSRHDRDYTLGMVNDALFGDVAKEVAGKKFRKKARKKAIDSDGNLIPDVAIELLGEVDEELAERFKELVEEHERILAKGKKGKKGRGALRESVVERRKTMTDLLMQALDGAYEDRVVIKDVTPRTARLSTTPVTHEVSSKKKPDSKFYVAGQMLTERVDGNAMQTVYVVSFPRLPKKITPRMSTVIRSYAESMMQLHRDADMGHVLKFDTAGLPEEIVESFKTAGARLVTEGTSRPGGKGSRRAMEGEERGMLSSKERKKGVRIKGIVPRLGGEEDAYTEQQKKRIKQFRRVSDVQVPQLWNADLLPKGSESDFNTGLFLATYDDWHSKTAEERVLADRQHRLNRDRLERWADKQGVRGFAYKRLLRDVAEAMLIRIDLDYWVHSDSGYSRGVNQITYTKGSDQSLWDALEARAEGKAKWTDRHRQLFKMAMEIRTEPKYEDIRQLIRDMNDAQVRITKMGRAAELFKGGIYSYASLGWKDVKGERVFEPSQGGVNPSAVGLLEVGQAGGPLREDVGYRRMEKRLVSVLDGWSRGYELILPNAIDAAARTHRVVTEARYNRAWIRGLEAAGLVRVIPEGKPSPGYVRLKADALSMYQTVPWIAKYINNATTHFGLKDITWTPLRVFMRMNFVAKHLMLSFGFFHHQAFMRSYLFTVEGSAAAKAMTEDGGVIAAAVASGASYAKAIGRMDNATMSRLEERFQPMAMGRKAWEEKHEDFLMLVRAGLTVQLSNEMTQTRGGAYYMPEDVSEVDGWFDGVRAKIRGWGLGKTGQAMIDMVDNVRIAQRETAEWLFNNMGTNLKIAAAMVKLNELRAKDIKRAQEDPEYVFELARIAAEQVNADFGGLDLRGRSGKLSDYFGEPGPRNPVHQMVMRGLFLAPDWTESNAVAFLGMLKRGKRFATPAEIQQIQTAAYRTMWLRVAGRAVMLQLALNMALAVSDPEKSLADMYAEAGFPGFGDADAPKASKLRWLDANISRFSPNESRKFLSVWGHFADPIKWGVEAVNDGLLAPFEKKGSSAVRGLYEYITGSNWAKRRYNTLQEFYGWGEYEDGRFKGQMTRPSSRIGHVRNDELPLWAFDQSMKFVPLQIRALIDYAMGSHDALDAFAQMLGAKMSRTYPD